MQIPTSDFANVNYMLNLQERISVDNHTATVKFIGSLPAWGPDVLAYGVEWDDVTRGKNSGSLDGVSYFQTRVDGAGSFLKASNRRILAGVSFGDALFSRYAGEENVLAVDRKITFGSKTVENCGLDKLNAILSNFTHLETLSLDKQKVCCAGQVPFLPKVKALDLSYNLLSSWQEVFKILEQMPGLRSLNVNGNRFEDLGRPRERFPSVTEVFLASTMMAMEQVQLLVSAFPNLTSLSLAGNISEEIHLHAASLNRLDLSFNALGSFPSLSFRNLSELILTDNHIQKLPGVPFPYIKVLDLRYNSLDSWTEIDRISIIFPHLNELRIDGCPLFADMSIEEVAVNLIARLECVDYRKSNKHLYRLNGSTILEDEIKNAELYFVSKVRVGQLTYTNEKRWNHLLEKHQLSEIRAPIRAADSRKIRLLVRLADEPDTELFSRVYLKKNMALRLKGTIAKHLQASVLDLLVFYYINEDEDSYNNAAKQYLHDDIASLENLALSNNQRIYVSHY